ncbi:MAG: hypothetical protein ACK4YP_22290 [Myxococcota bacterium]
MLLAPLSLPLLVGLAHAEPHGLVVQLRVDAAPNAAAVLLTPKEGTPTRVELKNDGNVPDVNAGDEVWAGSLWLEGDAFEVSVEVDGKTIPGGPVSWSDGDAARDLTVTLAGGSVSVEAGVSAPPKDGTQGSGTAPGAEGGGGGAVVQPGPDNKGSAGGLYLGFGVGVLALFGVGWLWVRSRPATGGGLPKGVSLVAEPGLLGAGSPSLSDGLQLWIVGPDDAEAVVRPLLATMARHHRVLVAAPNGKAVPAVFGGPVYRSANLRPAHVGDAAEALQEDGGAVAVLLAGTAADAASLKDYADLLPTGVGAVCVVAQDPGVPALARVTARRDGPVWVVQTPERTFRLAETPDGFVEEAAR